MAKVLGLGALYEDVVLTVPHFPAEDSKLRLTARATRLGGNLLNTFDALSDAPPPIPIPSLPTPISSTPTSASDKRFGHLQLAFCGAVGSAAACPGVSEALRARGIEPHLLFRDHHVGPPTAYILCSEATGSRTIVSHNAVPDPDTQELSTLLSPLAQWDWIHVEGRNCLSVRELLLVGKQGSEEDSRKGGGGDNVGFSSRPRPEELVGVADDARGFGGTLSVDFERPRPGLEELVGMADVLVIARGFAQRYAITIGEALTEAGQASSDSWARRCAGWIDAFGKTMKPHAVGYILLGSHGCVVFWKLGVRCHQCPPAGSFVEHKGWGLAHVVSRVKYGEEEGGGEGGDEERPRVAESVGSGDTFVAGIIWARLRGLDMVAAGYVANHVAGKKCGRTGFKGLWSEGVWDGRKLISA